MDRGTPNVSKPISIENSDPIYLRVKFDYRTVQFYYSFNGKKWLEIGTEYDAGKLSDEYCRGFTGTFIGLCVQDLSGTKSL